MKHTFKITLILLVLFLVAQLIGISVTASYSSFSNNTLPNWIAPPKDIAPQTSLISIIVAIIFGVVLMLVLMNFKAEIFLRIWFFLVVIIAIAITLNAGLSYLKVPFTISILISLPLAYFKIFKRDIRVHNFTELLIYPGVAALFVPLLNVWTVAVLLIVISLYDMYAVWHAGFMQKMAQYQIKNLKLFSGLFIPYMNKKERELINSQKKSLKSKSNSKGKKIKVNVAILGGGDIIFPIILAGVVFNQFGLFYALLISLGAFLGLANLFRISEKGKFYPAMPFISAGCFIALAIVYLINYWSFLIALI